MGFSPKSGAGEKVWREGTRMLPPLLHSQGARTTKLLRGSKKEPLFQAQGKHGARPITTVTPRAHCSQSG